MRLTYISAHDGDHYAAQRPSRGEEMVRSEVPGTAMSEELLFDDIEILIQTRTVSSCLFLIGVPVGKHVI